MNDQEMREFINKYVAALESEDVDTIEQFHAPDSVSESEGDPGKQMGRAQRRDYFKERTNAFSGTKMTVTNIDVDPKHDRAQFQWDLSAMHTGNFKGQPPTNKRVTISGRTEVQLSNGKIVREKSHQNMGQLMQQLRKP